MEFRKDQIAATQAELEKWRGLPHIDRRAIPGQGIDCIHLVFQGLYASGLIEPRKLPAYRTRWGLVSPENLMAAGFTHALHASRHKATEAQYGDIIIWKSGKQSNHCGIVAYDAAGDLSCWHVLKGGVVHPTPLKPVCQRAQELVRLDAPGWRIDPDQIKLEDLEI